MAEVIVTAERITKSYRTGAASTTVLSGVSLSIEQRECVFLLGPSGSGKSTLLSILGCVLSPDGGTLSICGEDVTCMSSKERARVRRELIGFVFQRFHLFQGLSALENVRVPLDLLSRPRRVATETARQLLASVGLQDKATSPIGQLSMGQRQRVAVARALAGDPPLLFADEPTASLDAHSGMVTVELLRQAAKERGKTVIIVTHDSRILHYADRILHLQDGQIKAEQSVAAAATK